MSQIKWDKPKKSNFKKTIWASWTLNFSWRLTEDYLDVFNWEGKYTILEQMRIDDRIKASLEGMKAPIKNAEILVLPQEWEDDKTSQEYADIISDNLFWCWANSMDNTFSQFLKECLTFLDFWFSLFEIILKRNDKWVLVKELRFLKQSTIDQWQTQDWKAWVTQMLRSPAIDWENKWDFRISIPANKLMLFTYDKEWDNYEWRSLLRSCYRAWKQKDFIQKADMNIIERYAWWVIKWVMPAWSSEEDISNFAKNLANIRTSNMNVLVVEQDEMRKQDFEFMDVKIPTALNLTERIEYYNNVISNWLLTSFLNSAWSSVWSNARIKSEMEFFLYSVNSLLYEITQTINNELIKKIAKINSWKTTPYLSYRDVEFTLDNNWIASAYKTLVDAWLITSWVTLEEYIRKQFDLPPIPSDQIKEIEEKHKTKEEPIWEPLEEEPEEPEEEIEEEEEEDTKWDIEEKTTKNSITIDELIFYSQANIDIENKNIFYWINTEKEVFNKIDDNKEEKPEIIAKNLFDVWKKHWYSSLSEKPKKTSPAIYWLLMHKVYLSDDLEKTYKEIYELWKKTALDEVAWISDVPEMLKKKEYKFMLEFAQEELEKSYDVNLYDYIDATEEEIKKIEPEPIKDDNRLRNLLIASVIVWIMIQQKRQWDKQDVEKHRKLINEWSELRAKQLLTDDKKKNVSWVLKPYNPTYDWTINITTKASIYSIIMNAKKNKLSKKEVDKRVEDIIRDRSIMFADNNTAFAYNVGKFLWSYETAVGYMWQRTISKEPRVDHLALVWSIRKVDEIYDTWDMPWVLPWCKCSEKPII